MEQGFFKLKKGQGYFEDVTQPNGVIVGKQIIKLYKTLRIESFVQGGGLVEVSEDSKEYQDYLKAEAAAAKLAAEASPKPEDTTAAAPVKKPLSAYDEWVKKDLIAEIQSRNEKRAEADKIDFDGKDVNPVLVAYLILDDAKQKA